MKIHPLLQDPNAVMVIQTPITGPVIWEDFSRAALHGMRVMQINFAGKRVVLKPNATSGEHFANPDLGITTHPGFIHGIVEYALSQGLPPRFVTIAEDPRDSDDNHPRHWRGTGFELVAQQTGARLYCPTTYTCKKVTVPTPLIYERLNVSRLAVDPNVVLINVPKLKTHNLAITTLGMKNLMGLVNVFDRHYCLQAWKDLPAQIQNNPQPRHEWFDSSMHELWQLGLAKRLVDTAQVIRPALTIVEGVVGREGTGFQRGQNRLLGLVVAGTNVVAVDALASYIMGFDPQALIYLKLAAEAGVGCNEVSKLKVYTEVLGDLNLCQDVETLRITPPFHVITNTLGEDPNPFQIKESVVDPSDSFFGKSHA